MMLCASLSTLCHCLTEAIVCTSLQEHFIKVSFDKLWIAHLGNLSHISVENSPNQLRKNTSNCPLDLDEASNLANDNVQSRVSVSFILG